MVTTAELAEGAIEELRARLRGSLLQPGDDAYDPARAVYNGMIDKHPGLIVRCGGVADVMNAVAFARDHDLLLAVRGGGHNVAGSSLCDGGARRRPVRHEGDPRRPGTPHGACRGRGHLGRA